MIRFFSAMMVSLLLGACSNQQIYEGLQSAESSRCVNQPANAYKECLQRNSMEYEEYTALRESDDEGR